ncbi:Hypothetical protein MAGb_3860 [Mycoplasmopsis agalactiae 14628]|uniref:Uncharacterized protein n=1 Tax=Mycoplasmopsis agalactiae 14628 TaxID=1110504 RepID=I5D6F9_MYCAA|nr:hypothetical protein [Mycoplasmopsis agalactiae]EIN15268.1 Hypothetical protein MAGb_3860 [Mycoplasmopsis agalactiae 14628]
MKKKDYDVLITVGAIFGIIGGVFLSFILVGIVSIVLSAMCLGSKRNDKTFILITAIINFFFAGLISGIFLIIAYSFMPEPEDNNQMQQ